MNGTRTVVRVNGSNAKHHLWNNNGMWWIHYTRHLPDFTKQRVRQSLKTRDLATAQSRRDKIFEQLGVSVAAWTTDVLPLAA